MTDNQNRNQGTQQYGSGASGSQSEKNKTGSQNPQGSLQDKDKNKTGSQQSGAYSSGSQSGQSGSDYKKSSGNPNQ